jgi:hypothetical protein
VKAACPAVLDAPYADAPPARHHIHRVGDRQPLLQRTGCWQQPLQHVSSQAAAQAAAASGNQDVHLADLQQVFCRSGKA